MNRWTVLEPAGMKIQPCGRKVPLVKAKCACGTVARIDPRNIKRNTSRSCGCYNAEVARQTMAAMLKKRYNR